jgi:hypothetical protein
MWAFAITWCPLSFICCTSIYPPFKPLSQEKFSPKSDLFIDMGAKKVLGNINGYIV